jgi:hypothetical protein
MRARSCGTLFVVSLFGACRLSPPPPISPPSGVYAGWSEALPAGQVLEIRGDRFRYRDYCDPDDDNALRHDNPVEGALRLDGDVVRFEGPDGWRLDRRQAVIAGVFVLMRPADYAIWTRTGTLPILGVVARLDGATFEDADRHRRSMKSLDGSSRDRGRNR